MRPSASTQASSRSAIVGASLIVFASSAFIMTLEIVAARLVAQHLGVSLYTWTAVIGVVLAGIAVGNYVGGKLADLYAPRALLTTLFLFASISSLSVLFIVDWMGSWERPEFISWPFWILRNVALTFFAPATIMGTISPVAAKLALTARREVGATVGTLYASGAAGSILGTFLTGYVLIDAFGTKTIVCVIAAGLGLLGLLVGRKLPRSPSSFFVAWLSFLFVISSLSVAPWAWSERWGHFFGLRFATDHLHYQDESSYFAIEIYDAEEFENTRVLALDHLVHSYVNMDDITQLEYGYETVYAAVTHHLIDTDRPLSALFHRRRWVHLSALPRDAFRGSHDRRCRDRPRGQTGGAGRLWGYPPTAPRVSEPTRWTRATTSTTCGGRIDVARNRIDSTSCTATLSTTSASPTT